MHCPNIVRPRYCTKTVRPALAPATMPVRRRQSLVRCSTFGLSHKIDDPERLMLLKKLDGLLSGLEVKTRKAKSQIAKVLHISSARLNHNRFNNKPRCTGLDIDIAWEAEPVNAQQPMQGMARVTLTTGPCDRVSVTDIQVLESCDEESPLMPSSSPAPPEVLLAVQSMDSVIMEHLNDFMWEMEQSNSFPLGSFECDDDEDDEGCLTLNSFDISSMPTPQPAM